MSVHYKFKNAINYDALKFDGAYISATDLKSLEGSTNVDQDCNNRLHSDGDSESDWDDDDDFVTKKINIRIKPVANKISASVDELRASVGTWKSLGNLVKPKSRRQNQVGNSSAQQLPVAFAIQECLNVRKPAGLDQLVGRLKMAVPKRITDIDFSQFENNLEITFVSLTPWETIRLNPQIVQEIVDENSFQTENTKKRLSIDMKSVQSQAIEMSHKQPMNKYFLMPEILRYATRSYEKTDNFGIMDSMPPHVNPLKAFSHWLCDLDVTKVRLDLEFLENSFKNLGITPNEIKNLKISLHVNGGVLSYQSKPEANWSPIDSKLTWSFSSLDELMQVSTVNGVTSCLAKFNLNDGPSTPSEINVHFSIAGKTLTGTKVILDNVEHFQITTQKQEVRTGKFRCEPPGL